MKTNFFDLEEKLGGDYADMLLARLKSGSNQWNFQIQRMAFDLPEEQVKRHKKMWSYFGGQTDYENNVLTISFCYGHGLPKPMVLAFSLMTIDIVDSFDDIDMVVNSLERDCEGYEYLGVSDDSYEALEKEASYHYLDPKTLYESFGMDDSEMSHQAVENDICHKMADIILDRADIDHEQYWFCIDMNSLFWQRREDWEKEANYYDDVTKTQKADEAYWASLERRGEIR